MDNYNGKFSPVIPLSLSYLTLVIPLQHLSELLIRFTDTFNCCSFFYTFVAVWTPYETKCVHWRQENHLSVFMGKIRQTPLTTALPTTRQRQGNILSAFITFFLSREEVGRQNVLYSIYWLDRLIGCLGSLVLYQQISYFLICSTFPSSSQHPHCGSVGIRMQSYYTLEGLSQSHPMAMNFKCRIKAYREAGAWGRLSQLTAN